MQLKTVWQSGSSDPENSNAFTTISQWWSNLNGKEVVWRQRLLNPVGDASDLNWDTQRFDEKLLLKNPQVRGITLFWQKPDSDQERNTTVSKLELDQVHQQLYIFPQSQKEVVFRVELPEFNYQRIAIQNPQWQATTDGSSQILTLRDSQQKLEIQITLDAAHLSQLKQLLG